MFRFLTNISIFRRLFLAAMLSAIVPGVVIFVLGSSYVGTLNTINSTVRLSNDAMKLATDQQADILRMNALLGSLNGSSSYSQSATIQTSQEVAQLTSDFDQKLSSYQSNYQIVTSTGMKSVRDVLNSNGLGNQMPISQHSMIFVVTLQWQKYKAAQNQVLSDLKKQADATTLTTDLNQANLLYLPLKGNLDNLVGLTESLTQVVVQVNASQVGTIILGTFFAFLFSTGVVFLIGYVVNLTITNPLRQLTSLTGRIAKGETEARAPVIGNDEISQVATSVNNMLDYIVHLLREAHFQRDVLQTRVEHLIKEVSGIGEGDLSVQAQVSSDTLGVLANSFNYMIRELGSLVIRIKVVAHEVEKLTETALERMTQLVNIADHQKQQIRGATVEVQAVADVAHRVAERAHTFHSIALDTRQTADTGREAVEQLIEGIGRIHVNMQSTSGKVKLLGDNSREINNVVKVITNVAYQTNRLALDAAVQAAMAGENGKGFAAVASDIRRLAEQVKEQASKITGIVRTVNENIDNAELAMRDTERDTAEGTRLAQKAGEALGSIFGAVDHQASEVGSINEMAAQQLQSTKAVVQIIQNVSLAAQESDFSTQAASQSVWKLAQLVEQLRSSVEAFKLQETPNYAQDYVQYYGQKRPISELQQNNMVPQYNSGKLRNT